MELIRKFAVVATALGTVMAASSAYAVDKISAVHAFPPFLVYTQTFLEMVEEINKRGEGVVEIEVRGGPEAIGMFQQPAAVRDGVVDMVHTPVVSTEPTYLKSMPWWPPASPRWKPVQTAVRS